MSQITNSKARVCKLILSRDIKQYDCLTFDGTEHVRIAALPGMWERTLTVGSAGKSFAATGWRIGAFSSRYHLHEDRQTDSGDIPQAGLLDPPSSLLPPCKPRQGSSSVPTRPCKKPSPRVSNSPMRSDSSRTRSRLTRSEETFSVPTLSSSD